MKKIEKRIAEIMANYETVADVAREKIQHKLNTKLHFEMMAGVLYRICKKATKGTEFDVRIDKSGNRVEIVMSNDFCGDFILSLEWNIFQAFTHLRNGKPVDTKRLVKMVISSDSFNPKPLHVVFDNVYVDDLSSEKMAVGNFSNEININYGNFLTNLSAYDWQSVWIGLESLENKYPRKESTKFINKGMIMNIISSILAYLLEEKSFNIDKLSKEEYRQRTTKYKPLIKALFGTTQQQFDYWELLFNGTIDALSVEKLSILRTIPSQSSAFTSPIAFTKTITFAKYTKTTIKTTHSFYSADELGTKDSMFPHKGTQFVTPINLVAMMNKCVTFEDNKSCYYLFDMFVFCSQLDDIFDRFDPDIIGYLADTSK